MKITESNYKQTLIGRIPKEWGVVRLGDLALDFIGGGTPSTSNPEYWNGEIPWMTSAHINGRVVMTGQRYITEKGLRESATGMVPKGNVLVATRVGIGKVAVNLIDIAISQDLTGVVIKKEEAIPDFVYWTLVKNENKLKALAQGSTIKGVLREDLAKVLIPLPPLPEQRRIAEILSTVDQAIQRVDEAIARTERLKRGLMQQLLTRGIGHKEFKDAEIGRIPKEWEVVRLGEVVEIHDSRRIPLSEMERSTRKGIYPYCGANGIIDYIDDYIFDGEYVLLAEDGGDYNKFGKSAYLISGKFWVNNHAHILNAIRDRATNLFLLDVINFLNLNPYIVGSTRKKLNQEQMREIRIPLPPLPEQLQIAEIFSTVDRKLELERKRKEKLEKIKRGLMNDLLIGKKRVKAN